jgi:two-component system cell cycle response regulator
MKSGRILIADDSAVARMVLTNELAAQGLEIIAARDGAEALTLARANDPEVILLDVEMPVLDGFGVLARLRADPALAEIPVVFLTGIDDSATAARGLAAGAHDYLRKPFEPVELLARVGAAQRTRRLQDELRRRNDQLSVLVNTDVLTGLFNRRHATEELERLVSRARRHDAPMSVVILDVDHFKSINDRFGHDVGDATLRELARRLSQRLRMEDTIARWGGEEFLVLLPDTTDDRAGRVADLLCEAVGGSPMMLPEMTLDVTISVGWATWRDGDENADALVRAADEALYAAKAAGRNQTRSRS